MFEAFANEDALAKWWGPVEAPIDVISLDFRPGGTFHYKMKGSQVNYGIFHYREIKRPDSIIWVKPPFEGIDVPREMLIKISLSEKDGITTLDLFSEPMHASESETSTFRAITDSMIQGNNSMFDQLQTYLATLQK